MVHQTAALLPCGSPSSGAATGQQASGLRHVSDVDHEPARLA
jgi:hypothetical protein